MIDASIYFAFFPGAPGRCRRCHGRRVVPDIVPGNGYVICPDCHTPEPPTAPAAEVPKLAEAA